MKSVVIGTAGHIDHGKSALVRALTGTDPDRLKEEKARGITIDLGFAHYESNGVNFAFVDVPGHERFVKNMLAGASGIDYVLLVVSADESVMPQTREHFDICRLLGVPAGIVAVTKADLVDAESIELVRLEVRDLVSGSFLEQAPIVAVSARTGEGLDALRHALDDLAATASEREGGGPARLPIDRAFSVKGFGTVVTGTLVSGALAIDDELELLPAGRRVKVRGLQVHGQKEARARVGCRTAANLTGVEVAEVGRGETLATPGTLETTRRLDAVVSLLPGARALRHGARVRFHQGTSELFGRVAVAVGDLSKADATDDVGRTLLAQEIPPGARAHVRLRLEAPAVLTRGDRFILRAYSPPVTIGGGEVLDPHPPRGGIRTVTGRARLRALDHAGPDREDRARLVMIGERGAAGLPLTALTTRAAVAPEDVARVVEGLVKAGHVEQVGQVLVPSSVLSGLAARLLKELEDFHRAQPLADGVPREELRERLFSRADAAVFERVLTDLQARRLISGRERLALTSHRVALSDDESRAHQAIEDAYRHAGLRPPDLAAVMASANVSAAVAERMIALLIRQKVLVKLDTLYFHANALDRLKQDVVALKTRGKEAKVDVGAFKETYGVSRKYAIPLLEYLDRERITRRVGESRVVL